MGTVYAYQRISTAEEHGKQKFARQDKALHRYCQEQKIEFDYDHDIYRDDRSGKTFEGRSGWRALDRRVVSGDTIIFKDICRFSRNVDEGLKKYMDLRQRNVTMVFIDNPTLNTDYIDGMDAAKEDCLRRKDNVTALTLDFIIRLLLTVELDRAEKEREITVQRIRDGISASAKKSGRPVGNLDKMTPELRADIIQYFGDRKIRQIDLMKKHDISRNTLRKYIRIIQGEKT